MRLLALTLFLGLTATCSADCTKESIVRILTSQSWLLAPTNDAAKNFCEGTGKAAFMTQLSDLTTSCYSNTNLKSLAPLLNMLSDVICSQDEDDQYCIDSFTPLVDFTALAANPESAIIDISKSFTIAKLTPACANPKCYNVVIRKVTHLVYKIAKSAGFLDDDANLKKFRKIAGDVASACQKNGDTFCAETWTSFLTDGKLDKAKICDNGDFKICARKFLAKQGPFMRKLPILAGVDVKNFCATATTKRTKMVKGVMKLRNLLYKFYTENKELIEWAIKQDIAFNIPGVLGEEVSIQLTKADDDTVSVTISIDGTEAKQIELKAFENMELLAKALMAKTATFPALDTLDDKSKKELGESKEMSQMAALEGVEDEFVASPTAAGPAQEGDVSSAAVPVVGIFSVMVGLLAFFF